MALTCQQIMALFAGWTTMLVYGANYVYGAIAPYLVSDLYYKGNKDISYAQLSIVLTVSMISTNFGVFLSSLKMFKFNYRVISFIGISGISASIYTLSYMSSLYTYIFFYGVCFGIFIGFGYLSGVRNCYDYLPDRKGLCSGVCMMGFGLGPVFFTIILTYLINPDNISPLASKKYPIEVALNVPPALRIIAIVYLTVGMIGVFFMKPKADKDKYPNLNNPAPLTETLIELKQFPIIHQKPNEEDQQHIPQSPRQRMVSKTITQPSPQKPKQGGEGFFQKIFVKAFDIGVVDMPEQNHKDQIVVPEAPKPSDSIVKKRRYYQKKEEKQAATLIDEQSMSKELFIYLYKKQLHMLVAILGLSSSFGLFIAFNYKSYGFYSIKNDKFMSFVGSSGALANSFSRLIWGALFDKFSYKFISTVINCCLLVGCALADYAGTNEFTYWLFVVFVYGIYGGNYPLYPPQTVKMLGKVLGAKVYFITYLGFTSGAIIQYLCCRFFIQPYGRDGYTYCFIIQGGMLIMAIFYSLTVDFPVYEGDYHHHPEKVDEIHEQKKRYSLKMIEKDLTA